MLQKRGFIISLAATVIFVLSSPAWSMISPARANLLDLYQSRTWVYRNVGSPDSSEWNSNFGTNLEIYRISGSPMFDSTFVGYSGDGFVHVMGQVYRPGTTSFGSICSALENKGASLVQSDWNGRVYTMRHNRTGRTIFAVVEPDRDAGPVLYLITREGWNAIN